MKPDNAPFSTARSMGSLPKANKCKGSRIKQMDGPLCLRSITISSIHKVNTATSLVLWSIRKAMAKCSTLQRIRRLLTVNQPKCTSNVSYAL